MRRLILAALVVGAARAAAVQGQDAQEGGATSTFRGSADFVTVDVYATADGSPVTDLRPDELQVHEDGVLQTIATFEHVPSRTGGPADGPEPDTFAANERLAAEPHARVTVAFLDTLHLGVGFKQRLLTPLEQLMEEAHEAGGVTAVMTPDMPLTDLRLSRRGTPVADILIPPDEVRLRPPDSHPRDFTEAIYDRCWWKLNHQGIAGHMKLRLREKLALDALESLTEYVGALREDRKTVIVASSGWGFGPISPESLAPADSFVEDEPSRGNVIVSSTSAAERARQIALCAADRAELAALDSPRRILDIIGRANRGNVSFYVIGSSRNPDLRSLAADTDGLAIITNNLGSQLPRILAHTASYYLLGYQSSKPADGTFRTIQVSVSRPGVTVRARPGYQSVAPPPARRAAPPKSPAALAFESLSAAAPPRDVLVHSSTLQGPGVRRLWIVAELAASLRRAAAWQAGGDAEILLTGGENCREQREGELSAGTTVLAMEIDLADSPCLSAAGMRHAIHLQLTPRATGSATVAEIVSIDAPPDPPVGSALFFRRAGPTRDFAATAEPRFRRADRLRLELPTTSSAEARAAVVDRAGSELGVPVTLTLRDDPSGRFRRIVVDLTLAPFAVGEYALMVTQGDATRHTAFRVVQ